MATGLASLTRIPAYTVPKPPRPSTSPLPAQKQEEIEPRQTQDPNPECRSDRVDASVDVARDRNLTGLARGKKNSTGYGEDSGKDQSAKRVATHREWQKQNKDQSARVTTGCQPDPTHKSQGSSVDKRCVCDTHEPDGRTLPDT